VGRASELRSLRVSFRGPQRSNRANYTQLPVLSFPAPSFFRPMQWRILGSAVFSIGQPWSYSRAAPRWDRLQSVRFNENKLGSAGGVSAMDSNSGNCARSGSGTLTLERFNMLMSCKALTTPFPW
jgi:hypothetical protein